MMNLLIEAFIFGIILLIVSIPIMGITNILYPSDYSGRNPPKSSKNKYYIATIIIGMLTHLLCEYSGITKSFCKDKTQPIKDVRITHPASW